MDWKTLEQKVRTVAALRWNCNATTETIAGIKCDCVLKPTDDYWNTIFTTGETIQGIKVLSEPINVIKMVIKQSL